MTQSRRVAEIRTLKTISASLRLCVAVSLDMGIWSTTCKWNPISP